VCLSWFLQIANLTDLERRPSIERNHGPVFRDRLQRPDCRYVFRQPCISASSETAPWQTAVRRFRHRRRHLAGFPIFSPLMSTSILPCHWADSLLVARGEHSDNGILRSSALVTPPETRQGEPGFFAPRKTRTIRHPQEHVKGTKVRASNGPAGITPSIQSILS
jgi:hypothetical protein